MMRKLLTDHTVSSLIILHFLFFLSGIAALIYQLMWQRMLFNLFGVDLESITIVVSVFMLGLGVGSIIGGYFADKFLSRLLFIYLLAEITIGVFGLLSPFLIAEISALPFIQNSRWTTFVLSYIVLFCPTALLGMTFPILVRHTVKLKKNVGYSVGGLYFSNTIGGAVGAFLAGFILLNYLDMNTVTYSAALINFAIAFIAIIAFGRINDILS